METISRKYFHSFQFGMFEFGGWIAGIVGIGKHMHIIASAIIVTKKATPKGVAASWHTFRYCVGFADVLHPFHAHAGDLQGDAACPTGHVNRGAQPAGPPGLRPISKIPNTVARFGWDLIRGKVIVFRWDGPCFFYPEAISLATISLTVD